MPENYITWTDTAMTTLNASLFRPSRPPRLRDARGRFIPAEGLRPGTIVRIANNAYNHSPNIGGTRGRLTSEFYGAMGEIVERYTTDAASRYRNSYRVRLATPNLTGRPEVIVGVSYLTVITNTFAGIQPNDRVLVQAERPLCCEHGDQVLTRFRGAEVRVVALDSHMGGNSWMVADDEGVRSVIWANHLTVVERNGQRSGVSQRETNEVRCLNPYCNRVLDSLDDRMLITNWREQPACANCHETCAACSHQYITAEGVLREDYDGERICNDCSGRCEHCNTRYNINRYDECPDYEDHPLPRGVTSYQHTTPTMWLGGPLKKKEDGKIDTSIAGAYYIGFELEITAAYSESAMPIYDWAEANLGSREAIQCKEDGSVQGFEIVSMPMTPEFFESVNWESFMDLINANHPTGRRADNRHTEPNSHGLHVHIGRVAFERDDVAQAAFCYLLAQGDNLERIGRRSATNYCEKINNPVTQHMISMRNNGKQTPQTDKAAYRGSMQRGAINLYNSQTIEVRAFRSTRVADELRDAVRLTYVAAEYIRQLRATRSPVSPKALHWAEFAKWTATAYPEAFASIAGFPTGSSNKRELVGAAAGTANFEF